MRGKVFQYRFLLHFSGITPACAGKRTRIPGQRLPMWDHPRVCGEKAGFFAFCSTSAGSPPRVRGKAIKNIPEAFVSRITPACAGKRGAGRGKRRPAWDHPRVCGEKNILYRRCPRSKGSPPRVRGKVCSTTFSTISIGITPACAGKSRGTLSRPITHSGSPPRVRGKGHGAVHTATTFGITPACAGKSSPAARLGTLYQDQPRVCGEKVNKRNKPSDYVGSPPRVRGKAHL